MDLRDGTPPPVPEKLVARLWDQQRAFALPLRTTEGEEIQVVYRGRRRWDRGPDFAGALIASSKARLSHGDVEVHTRSSDWRAHGHHRDPHYNGVILHIVLWDDAAELATRADGVRIPVVALAPRLTVPLDALLDAPENETHTSFHWPCWRGSPEDEALAGLLEECGLERFESKAARLESDLAGGPWGHADQLLYEGIATALGYSQNSEPFRRLTQALPLGVLLAHASQTEALLLGAAGLLPSQRGIPACERDSHGLALEEMWAASRASPMAESLSAAEWEFFRVRPANFPTRRVAALAMLVDRWPRDGLAETLADLVRRSAPRGLARAVEALLLGGGREDYWARHCDFGLPLRRPGQLIGRQRAAEVVVNVFLPFLAVWATLKPDADLEARVRQGYGLYPKRGDNELSRYVAVQVTGLARPRAARSACRQQGLLHIYWRWCEAKRCGECPVQTSRHESEPRSRPRATWCLPRDGAGFIPRCEG